MKTNKKETTRSNWKSSRSAVWNELQSLAWKEGRTIGEVIEGLYKRTEEELTEEEKRRIVKC